jgi:acetyl esterase
MLDPQLQALLERAQAAGAPALHQLPVEACRGYFRELLRATEIAPVQTAVDDRRIDGPGGKIALRIYTPLAAATGARGALLYLHGGGFVVGDLETSDTLCRRWCDDADCVVVSVHYRLAPEHRFPAAIDDVWAAWQWLVSEAQALSVDAQRIAVAGDSAGGNLAAALALMARDRGGVQPRYQVLIYPVLSARPELYPSYADPMKNLVINTQDAYHFWRLYFGGESDAPNAYGAPLLATGLSRLPPALVLVAGHDILRDEAVDYANRLCAAGVQATLVEYATLAHGFINMGGALDAAQIAIDQVGSALRRSLAQKG